MVTTWDMDLQLFADGGATGGTGGGDGAATGAAGDPGKTAEDIRPGDVLESGARVDARLAASMKKHPERYAQARKQQAAQPQQQARQDSQPQEGGKAEDAGKALAEEWESLKKDKFRELYGQDVQKAVQDRFKNQADANEQLKQLKPMLDALMKSKGAKTLDDLQKAVLSDDSLFEEEAEAAGMTVDAYRTFKALEAENEERKRKEQQSEQNLFMRRHFQKLSQQAENLKAKFPDFDLQKELATNEAFRRMTSPNGGVSVEDAYYAVHHNELMPQIMAYGVKKAQDQISQSLTANAKRPMEGALGGGSKSAAADVGLDPRNLTRAQREDIKQRVRRGEKITFR